jgi:hypothetical protein
VIPFKAIAMNVVSVAASFGALVWIFQDGHLRWLLDFETQAGIEVTIPVVLLAVVFGLSMDYEIFMLSRIKEEFDKSGDNTSSVAIGLEHTSSIITRAALLLIAVVGAFAFGEFIFVKEIGVGARRRDLPRRDDRALRARALDDEAAGRAQLVVPGLAAADLESELQGTLSERAGGRSGWRQGRRRSRPTRDRAPRDGRTRRRPPTTTPSDSTPTQP